MSCERLGDELVHYQRGELGAEVRAEIGLHLEDCPGCRRALAEIAEIELAIAGAPPIEASPRFEENMRRALPRVYAAGPAVLRPAARVRRLPRVVLGSLVLHAAAILVLSAILVLPGRSPFAAERDPVSVRIVDEDELLLPAGPSALPAEECGPDHDLLAPEQIETDDEPSFASLPGPSMADRRPSATSPMRTQAIRRTLLAELAPWIRGRFGWRDEAGAERVAVLDRGLEALAEAQGAGGSWGEGSDRVRLTGLAALAFLGAGHSGAIDDPHGYTVSGAVAFLDSMRDPHTGRIGMAGITDHAIATLALVEAAFLVRGPRGAMAYQSSVDWILVAQDPIGSWEGDPAVTGWQVATLAVARAVGLSVPSPQLERTAAWLESLGSTDYTVAAIAVRSAILLERDRPIPPALLDPAAAPDVEALYHAALALRAAEAPGVEAWEAAARDRLPASLSTEVGYEYVMAILALEAPFRYGSFR